MSAITMQKNPMHTVGELPAVGENAPDFTLTKVDLTDVSLKDFHGKRIVLNIFPSLDTGVCAQGMRRFNEIANKLENTVILCVSHDLPFAQKRFCGAENLDQVVPVSAFRQPDFGQHYGLTLVDGAIKGLLARAVVVIDTQAKISYTQLAPEIAEEVDYERLVKFLQS